MTHEEAAMSVTLSERAAQKMQRSLAGRGKGLGTNLNCPLARGAGIKEFRVVNQYGKFHFVNQRNFDEYRAACPRS